MPWFTRARLFLRRHTARGHIFGGVVQGTLGEHAWRARLAHHIVCGVCRAARQRGVRIGHPMAGYRACAGVVSCARGSQRLGAHARRPGHHSNHVPAQAQVHQFMLELGIQEVGHRM